MESGRNYSNRFGRFNLKQNKNAAPASQPATRTHVNIEWERKKERHVAVGGHTPFDQNTFKATGRQKHDIKTEHFNQRQSKLCVTTLAHTGTSDNMFIYFPFSKLKTHFSDSGFVWIGCMFYLFGLRSNLFIGKLNEIEWLPFVLNISNWAQNIWQIMAVCAHAYTHRQREFSFETQATRRHNLSLRFTQRFHLHCVNCFFFSDLVFVYLFFFFRSLRFFSFKNNSTNKFSFYFRSLLNSIVHFLVVHFFNFNPNK